MAKKKDFISYKITERRTVIRHYTFMEAILYCLEDGKPGWEIYNHGRVIWQSEPTPKAETIIKLWGG